MLSGSVGMPTISESSSDVPTMVTFDGSTLIASSAKPGAGVPVPKSGRTATRRLGLGLGDVDLHRDRLGLDVDEPGADLLALHVDRASRSTGWFTSMPDGLMLTSATTRSTWSTSEAAPRTCTSSALTIGSPISRPSGTSPGSTSTGTVRISTRSIATRTVAGFTVEDVDAVEQRVHRDRQHLGLGGTLHVVLRQVDGGLERLFADRGQHGPRGAVLDLDQPEVAAHHDRLGRRVHADQPDGDVVLGELAGEDETGVQHGREQDRRQLEVPVPQQDAHLSVGAYRRWAARRRSSRPAPRDRSAGRPRHGPGQPASGRRSSGA